MIKMIFVILFTLLINPFSIVSTNIATPLHISNKLAAPVELTLRHHYVHSDLLTLSLTVKVSSDVPSSRLRLLLPHGVELIQPNEMGDTHANHMHTWYEVLLGPLTNQSEFQLSWQLSQISAVQDPIKVAIFCDMGRGLQLHKGQILSLSPKEQVRPFIRKELSSGLKIAGKRMRSQSTSGNTHSNTRSTHQSSTVNP